MSARNRAESGSTTSGRIVRLLGPGLALPLLLSLASCDTAWINMGGISGGTQTHRPAVTSADADKAKTDMWIRELTGLSPASQSHRAQAVWRDASQPEMLRDRATFILATRPGSQSLAAQQHLANRYIASSRTQRADMERLLTADLLTADAETLRNLGGSVPRVQESQFPWNLTVWHAAQRNLLPDSYGILARLADPALYADAAVIGLQPVADPGSVSGAPALHSGRAALILPLTGSYSAVGKQVANGAKVAAESLARQGVRMDVQIIDSEVAGWQSQVAALPPDCIVVGGPLRADAYAALKSAGLTGRALFTFLPLMPDPAEEGVLAWRFFTSPQDQVDAVLDFTIGGLGIHSYGVFAPNDSYGRRMTDIFLQAASMRGIRVTTGAYPAEDMASWTAATGSFVGGVTPEKGAIPTARAGFDAIFLPDSWKNMDMIISSLHYHGAHTKVMMGTGLWEQALAGAKGLNTATYGQTIFPGVWNSQATNPAAISLINGMAEKGGRADDWAVLGFDFVQFAAVLGLSAPIDAASLNAKLGAGVSLDWAGAPMVWDSRGKGHRRLNLFQPSRNGMVPLDREAFIAYRSGSGTLPNAEAGQEVPAARYDPEMLAPDLDALVNAIVGSESAPAGETAGNAE